MCNSQTLNKSYLSLGSNIGNKKKYLDQVIETLNSHSQIQNLNISPFIETKPWGVNNQPNYLNAAVSFETNLSIWRLFRWTQQLEKELGRDQKGLYLPRTIDIDILFYNDLILTTSKLCIPHPRLHERDFVLEPMEHIAPDVIHPIFNVTITELRKNINLVQ